MGITTSHKIIAIMQPTYLPWLGYFDLIDQSDVFVYLDNVQFAKRSWQQRNRIKTPHGLKWLTVPVLVSGRYDQLIHNVEISDDGFADEHIALIRQYYWTAGSFARFGEQLAEQIRNLSAMGKLVELNCGLINWLCQILNIKTQIFCASQLGVNGKRSGLLAALCEALGATTYLSALGSAGYLLEDVNEFQRRGIDVAFHHYEHPIYIQQFPPFVPQASVVDLLLNEGDHALDILRSGRRECYKMEQVRAMSFVTPLAEE